MSISRIFWGLAIILFGIVLIGVNFGVVSSDIFASAWKLWPLILIVVGLSILAKSIPPAISTILSIIFVICFIALAGLIFLVPNSVSWISNNSDQSAGVKIISEPIQDGVDQAEVNIITGSAKIDIQGGSTNLIDGQIKSDYLTNKISREKIETLDKITIESENKTIKFPRTENTWNLNLIENLPLTLNLTTGVASSDINLQRTQLKKLSISGGATSTNLTLPSVQGIIESDINLGVSSIKINIPKDSGVKVFTEGGTSGENFISFGLSKSGEKEYKSSNYEDSKEKIVLTFRTGVSNIELISY